ncbi:Small subunit processome complex component [Ascosphaera pollenicola]|nr:Small subunit processome complex component [Ascosphaera pollenicola]
MIAAQESKALEDLSSEFYFIDTAEELCEKTDIDADENNGNKYKDHIAPWELRVLAVRLQSLGFSDARRGIAGLYDLGLYARNQLSHKKLLKEDVQLWIRRLADLGIRVVNSLIEMGDLETARRTLATLRPTASLQSRTRMVMLYLYTGDVRAAEKVINEIHDGPEELLKCLLLMAQGRYMEAIAAWEALLPGHVGKDDEGIIRQNLAVCMLFTGRLDESRKSLEALVENNHSFQSLIFNLATIYELCSERSSLALKMTLTETVARQPSSGEVNVERPNAEFKI